MSPRNCFRVSPCRLSSSEATSTWLAVSWVSSVAVITWVIDAYTDRSRWKPIVWPSSAGRAHPRPWLASRSCAAQAGSHKLGRALSLVEGRACQTVMSEAHHRQVSALSMKSSEAK